MEHLEVSGVPVLYIGRTVPKGYSVTEEELFFRLCKVLPIHYL